MAVPADIDELVKRLSLAGAPNLGKAHILELQRTLFEACRIHDPEHAEAMAEVLARMQVTDPVESGGSAGSAAPAGAFEFTSPRSSAAPAPPPRAAEAPFLAARQPGAAAGSPSFRFEFTSPARKENQKSPSRPPKQVPSPIFEFTSPDLPKARPLENNKNGPAETNAEFKFVMGAAPTNAQPTRPKPKEKQRRSGAARRLDFVNLSIDEVETVPRDKATNDEALPTMGPQPTFAAAPAAADLAPPPLPPQVVGGFALGAAPPRPAPRAPRKSARGHHLGGTHKATQPRVVPAPEHEERPPVVEDELMAEAEAEAQRKVGAGFCLGKSEGPLSRKVPSKLSARAAAAKERVAMKLRAEEELRRSQDKSADAPVMTGGTTTTTSSTTSTSTSTTTTTTTRGVHQHKEELGVAAAAGTAYDVAGAAYSQGRYTEAVAGYSHALASAPARWGLAAKALGNRAAALTMLDCHADALRDCDEATRLDSSLYKVHNRAARLRLSEGDEAGARQSLDWARQAALREGVMPSEDARAALATAAVTCADLEQYLEALRRARVHARRQDENDASSTTSSSHGGGGQAAKCSEKGMLALLAAEEAVAIAPRSRAARCAKARALAALDSRWAQLGDFCVATAVLAAKKTIDAADAGSVARALSEFIAEPEGPELDSLAELYVRCLRKTEAADEAADEAKSRGDAALRAVAQHPRAHTAVAERCSAELRRASRLRRAKARADDAYTRGHYRAAIAMYKDALRLDSHHFECDAIRATLHCNVAAAALVLDRSAEAIEHCTHALKIRPQYARARLRRARARAKIGDYEEAIHDYDAYLRAARDRGEVDDQVLADVRRERRKVLDDRNTDTANQTPSSSSSSSSAAAAAAASAGGPPHPPPPWRQPYHRKNSPPHMGGGPTPQRPPRRASKSNNNTASSSSSSANDFRNGGYYARARPKSTASTENYAEYPSSSSSRRAGSATSERILASDKSTHYACLGLAMSAAHVEIKRAYAKLALEYHPDRNSSANATSAMARINAAYEVLGDRTARAQYDLTLPASHRYRR